MKDPNANCILIVYNFGVKKDLTVRCLAKDQGSKDQLMVVYGNQALSPNK